MIFNFNFKLIYLLQKHSMSIKKIFYIEQHNIFVTVCKNELKIQYLKGDLNNLQDCQVVRKLKNILKSGYNLKQIEMNFKMNLILMSDLSNELTIIDFEFGKVHGFIQLEKNAKIICFKLLQELGLIIIFTDDNTVRILEYQYDKVYSGLKLSLNNVKIFSCI